MSKFLKDLFIFYTDLLTAAIILLEDLSKSFQEYVATVPSVTVAVAPASLDVGQPITISGVVSSDTGVPAPTSTPVSIQITDAAGNAQPIINATTGTIGTYSVSFIIPVGFASGPATVDVTALGATGTATFTWNDNKIIQ